MPNLLVNSPSGLQEIVEISESGSYFDSSLVIWDERADGPLPSITLGKMVRIGGELIEQADYVQSHATALLNEYKATKLGQLSGIYTSIIYSEITVNNKTWLADPHSRELLSQVLSVGSVPPLMHWRDSTGTPHIVTREDLQAIGYAILVRGAEADFTLMNKSYLVGLAASIEAVDAITWE